MEIFIFLKSFIDQFGVVEDEVWSWAEVMDEEFNFGVLLHGAVIEMVVISVQYGILFVVDVPPVIKSIVANASLLLVILYPEVWAYDPLVQEFDDQ